MFEVLKYPMMCAIAYIVWTGIAIFSFRYILKIGSLLDPSLPTSDVDYINEQIELSSCSEKSIDSSDVKI